MKERGKLEHRVTMFPGVRGTGLYNAACSCGYRMFNSTPGLIGRHGQIVQPSERPDSEPPERVSE